MCYGIYPRYSYSKRRLSHWTDELKKATPTCDTKTGEDSILKKESSITYELLQKERAVYERVVQGAMNKLGSVKVREWAELGVQ